MNEIIRNENVKPTKATESFDAIDTVDTLAEETQLSIHLH